MECLDIHLNEYQDHEIIQVKQRKSSNLTSSFSNDYITNKLLSINSARGSTEIGSVVTNEDNIREYLEYHFEPIKTRMTRANEELIKICCDIIEFVNILVNRTNGDINRIEKDLALAKEILKICYLNTNSKSGFETNRSMGFNSTAIFEENLSQRYYLNDELINIFAKIRQEIHEKLEGRVNKKAPLMKIQDIKGLKMKVGKEVKLHKEAIRCAVVLRDGRLVTGSKDKSIKIWNPQSFKCIKELTHHTSHVVSLCELDNGILASGSGDTTIALWDVSNNFKLINVLNSHKNTVYSIIQLRDGPMLTASGDKTIRVFDPYDKYLCNKVLEGQHKSGVLCLLQLRDGKIVSGSSDTTMVVWDSLSFKAIKSLNGHTNSVFKVIQLSDDSICSASGDKTIRLWNSTSFCCFKVLEGHTNYVNCIIELKEGKVMSGSNDKVIRLWDTSDGYKCNKVVGEFNEWVSTIVQLSDDYVIIGLGDGRIKLIE
jgi:WD40 repeat protein